MKKYISVLMLHVRSSFYKILVIFAGLFGTQIFLLTKKLHYYIDLWNTDGEIYMSLDVLIDDSLIYLVFLIGFLLITLILTSQGFEFKEKISYTIRRLSIPEKQYYLIQGFYNSMIYLLLFLVELMIIAAFAFYSVNMIPDTFYSNQTLFLAFYTNDFLHSLLPLEETVRVVRNVFLIFTFGYVSAYQSYAQRRGKKQWLLIIVTFLTVLNFKSALGTFLGDAFLICVYAVAFIILSYNLLQRGSGYEI